MAVSKKETTTTKPKKKVVKKQPTKDIENEEIMVQPIKKQDNKYKPAIIVGVIAIFIIALIISNYESKGITPKTDDIDITMYTTATTVAEYLEKTNETAVNIFYIARPTCSYCVQFAPILSAVIQEYDLTVNYINIDEETSTDVGKIDSSSPKLTGFGTPTLAITENGEVTYAKIGYMEKAELIQFLKDSKIITE